MNRNRKELNGNDWASRPLTFCGAPLLITFWGSCGLTPYPSTEPEVGVERLRTWRPKHWTRRKGGTMPKRRHGGKGKEVA